jgi:small subunit ribosomal protein S17
MLRSSYLTGREITKMKVFVGKVIGTKMAKTAVVSVERVVIHPLYKKRFKRDRKYQVHDELGVKLNDVVKFAASKPYSKTKKWKILEVVSLKKVPSETAKASHGERNIKK